MRYFLVGGDVYLRSYWPGIQNFYKFILEIDTTNLQIYTTKLYKYTNTD